MVGGSDSHWEGRGHFGQVALEALLSDLQVTD